LRDTLYQQLYDDANASCVWALTTSKFPNLFKSTIDLSAKLRHCARTFTGYALMDEKFGKGLTEFLHWMLQSSTILDISDVLDFFDTREFFDASSFCSEIMLKSCNLSRLIWCGPMDFH
jgi:hypothetical protein